MDALRAPGVVFGIDFYDNSPTGTSGIGYFSTSMSASGSPLRSRNVNPSTNLDVLTRFAVTGAPVQHYLDFFNGSYIWRIGGSGASAIVLSGPASFPNSGHVVLAFVANAGGVASHVNLSGPIQVTCPALPPPSQPPPPPAAPVFSTLNPSFRCYVQECVPPRPPGDMI